MTVKDLKEQLEAMPAGAQVFVQLKDRASNIHGSGSEAPVLEVEGETELSYLPGIKVVMLNRGSA